MENKHTPAPTLKAENEKLKKELDSAISYHLDILRERNALKSLNAKMLESLKRALHDFKSGTWTEETYNVIESAIAKATL